MAEDSVETDGCMDTDMSIDTDDDETAGLRPLFPEGDQSPTTEEQWRELFPDGGAA